MKFLTIAAMFALAFALAGCGDKNDGNEATGSASPTESEAIRDATMPAASITTTDFAKSIATALKKAKTGHVSLTVTSLTVEGYGADLTADGDFDVTGDFAAAGNRADTAFSLTINMGRGDAPHQLQLRLVDQVLYVNLGALTGDKFAKVDLGDESNPMSGMFGALIHQFDLNRNIETLKNAVTSIEKKGDPVRIDGVEAQPYEIVLDPSKFTSLLGDAAAGQAMPDELTLVVFVGPDDLPRRFTTEVAGATIQLDFSNWGEPVDVAAPPASKVTGALPFGSLMHAA